MDEERNRIARQFHALADPNRLWILELLDEEERNGQGILEAVPIVQSTLSHHMKILGEARLVDIRREGKWTWYTLNRESLAELRAFLEHYTGGAGSAADRPSAEKERKPDREKQAAGQGRIEAGQPEAEPVKSVSAEVKPAAEKKKKKKKDKKKERKKDRKNKE